MLSTMPNYCSAEPCPVNPFTAFETGIAQWDCSDLFSAIQLYLKPIDPSPGFQDPNPDFENPNNVFHNPNPDSAEVDSGSGKPSPAFVESDRFLGTTGVILSSKGSDPYPEGNRMSSNQTGSIQPVETIDGRKRKRMHPNRANEEPKPDFKHPISGFEIPSPGIEEPDPVSVTTGLIPSCNGSDSDPEEKHRNRIGSDRSYQMTDEQKQKRMKSNRESARRSRLRKQNRFENLRTELNQLKSVNQEIANRLRTVLYQCHHVQTENERLRSEHDILRYRLTETERVLIFQQIHEQQQLGLQIINETHH